MQTLKSFAASLTLLIVLFVSCQKGISELNELTVPLPIENKPNITTSISGRIVDKENKPVENANIKIGSATTTTNINGQFVIKDVLVKSNAAYVQVNKSGYFTGSRTLVATEASDNYVEIKLLPNTRIGSFNSNTGGTVSLPNGTSVTLPASSVVVVSSNAVYTGNVHVSFAWIDPTSPDLQREMPGDLRGIDEQNLERGLQSFGMVAVDLTGDGGEKLQIAQGKSAGIKFLLPASIVASAPATIALWSFNEKNGLWKQEGNATKSGNFYQATVSHFSFWNCDAPFPIADFTATIKDQFGQPLKHILVKLTRTTTKSSTTGYTDTAGVVRGKVPVNEALVLEVQQSNTCSNILHTKNIGPFSSASALNITVTLTQQQVATVSGTATNCTGAPVVNGFADLTVGQQHHRVQVLNGAFNFNIFLCTNNVDGRLVITDMTANSQSAPSNKAITFGNNTFGAVSACGTTISRFINYTLNGVVHSLIFPADSANVSVSSQPPQTRISAFSIPTTGQQVNRYINFNFAGNTVGATTISSLTVTGGSTSASLAPSSTIPVNITEFGAPGGFIAGSFSGTVRVDSSTTQIPIQCNFRVLRYY
jgi:hypothetical protein